MPYYVEQTNYNKIKISDIERSFKAIISRIYQLAV